MTDIRYTRPGHPGASAQRVYEQRLREAEAWRVGAAGEGRRPSPALLVTHSCYHPGRSRNALVHPGRARRGIVVEPMRWNLRLTAAERGIWKSTEMRRRLADAGLVISAGKMSALWTGTPTTIRLEDLDVICSVLESQPGELLVCEPDKVAARRPRRDRHAR